jgi:hypothetical protein
MFFVILPLFLRFKWGLVNFLVWGNRRKNCIAHDG